MFAFFWAPFVQVCLTSVMGGSFVLRISGATQLRAPIGDAFQVIPKRSYNAGAPMGRSWLPAPELERFHISPETGRDSLGISSFPGCITPLPEWMQAPSDADLIIGMDASFRRT